MWRFLACFDITDDKNRRECVKVMLKYGRRCQFSVFEMNLSATLFRQLKIDLDKLVFDSGDKVYIYQIPSEDERKILRLGPYEKEQSVYIV